MKHILITGGAGFIGSNTAIHFGKENQVTIIDNFSRQGVEINAQLLQSKNKHINIIKDDVLNINAHSDVIKNSDVIIHLAGQTAVTNSLSDPMHDFFNNTLATVTLLEAIRKFNPTAIIIFSSTNKVYGHLTHHQYQKSTQKQQYMDLGFPEGIGEEESLNFASPYGCSKGAADQYVLDYFHSYGIKSVVFRQSCIYGPFQHGVEDQGWVAHFSKQLLQGNQLKIFGTGYQVRDLLHVDDVVNAYELAIANIDQVKGMAFNIGGGVTNAYSLLEVIELIEEKLNLRAEVKHLEPRIGDQLSFISKNQLIKEKLNWAPSIPFSTGLSQLIKWQQNNLINES